MLHVRLASLSIVAGLGAFVAFTPAQMAAAADASLGAEDGKHVRSEPRLSLELSAAEKAIWAQEVGGGFQKGAWHFGYALGGGIGMSSLGSTVSHDMVPTSLQAGRVVSGVMGAGTWFQGNCEMFGTVIAGAQVHPETDYLVGFNPGFRYHFATRTPWVPFLSLSAGVMATDIKEPDLSTVFQFNEQFGAGFNWFLKERTAFTLEYRLIHISNAGITQPNHGVNSHLSLAGFTHYF
jgi:hypothetical protein